MAGGYPIMLDIEGKSCVVVGGGSVAVRKIASLLEAGAKVTVVSPIVEDEIENWERNGSVSVLRRSYDGPEILRNAALVFAATSIDDVNEAVCQDAKAMNLPVNDASKPDRGTFLLPAVLRRGSLVITVSTSGASPGLAVKLRDNLAEQFGPEYEIYIHYLAELRESTLRKVKNPELRLKIFQNALKFDILELIRDGRFDDYRRHTLAEIECIDDRD